MLLVYTIPDLGFKLISSIIIILDGEITIYTETCYISKPEKKAKPHIFTNSDSTFTYFLACKHGNKQVHGLFNLLQQFKLIPMTFVLISEIKAF